MKQSAPEKSCPLEKIKSIWSAYKPLIIILVFCVVLASLQKDFFMYSFMGYFFILLAMFKLFDLKAFVEGFSAYDIVASKSSDYAYLYPFIELALGLSYLARFELFFTSWLTLIVMAISVIGVIRSVLAGKKIKCACLGTVLNVPLSSVSIVENLSMGVMAAYKLFFTF